LRSPDRGYRFGICLEEFRDEVPPNEENTWEN